MPSHGNLVVGCDLSSSVSLRSVSEDFFDSSENVSRSSN